MQAEILAGGEVSAAILVEVAAGVQALEASTGVVPGLAVLLVGGRSEDRTWLELKSRSAAEAGMRFRGVELPGDISIDELLGWIEGLNADPDIHGILVQLPLPEALPLDVVREAVHPMKDVDAFHPINAGRLGSATAEVLAPCTAGAVLELLRRSGHAPEGRHVVIVAGDAPFADALLPLILPAGDRSGTRVTVVRPGGAGVGRAARLGEILIVAAGEPGIITADMVRPGAVVVDTGLHRRALSADPSTRRTLGDVDDGVREVASAMTPVPGGIGPVIVAVLLQNTLRAARSLSEAVE